MEQLPPIVQPVPVFHQAKMTFQTLVHFILISAWWRGIIPEFCCAVTPDWTRCWATWGGFEAAPALCTSRTSWPPVYSCSLSCVVRFGALLTQNLLCTSYLALVAKVAEVAAASCELWPRYFEHTLWSSKRRPQSQFKSEDKEIAIISRSCNLREEGKWLM